MSLRRAIGLLAVAALPVLFGLPLLAQPFGSEFRVNAVTAGVQTAQSVAFGPTGDFVVVWQDHQPGADEVYGRRYGATSGARGAPFRLNVAPASGPAVAVDPTTGVFLVAFAEAGQGIVGRRYDAGGAPLGSEFRVNTYALGQSPAVAASSAGFVVVWAAPDSGTLSVFGQRLTSGGLLVGPEFRVNTNTFFSNSPSVSADAAGDFVVAWQSTQDPLGYGVFARRYAASGAPLGAEFRVNTYTSFNQLVPSVAAFPAGGFVVTWESYSENASVDDVYAQRYDALGLPLGAEFRVNSYTSGQERAPRVAADGAGAFVVVWEGGGQDGSNYGILAQRYAPDGSVIGGELLVNTYTTSGQRMPAVAASGDGRLVVVWQSYGEEGGLDIGLFAKHSGIRGDVNGDGAANVTDVFHLINFLFASGAPPVFSGDVDGDGIVNVSDVFYLINHLFAGGPAPR
jgi:dockerin type I repeat protein